MGDGSPGYWPPFSMLLLTVTAVYVFGMAIVLVWLRRARQRLVGAPRSDLVVSILKPLCGVDEQLEANLESFTKLEYPHWELLCCSRDPADPALAVARRVAARHPECRIQIVAGAQGSACNPKVMLLEHLVPLARGDVFWISDSNVRVRPADLDQLLVPFTDRHVGLVFQPVVGVDEQTIASACENFKLTENAGGTMIFVKLLAGVNAVMGKGILIRRRALQGMHGFERLRDVLAEDYLMGIEVARAGWKLVLSPTPALAVHRRWSLKSHFARQSRHAGMRARLSPWTYPLEILLNPLAVALLPLALTGVTGLKMFLATVVVKTTLETVVVRALRGTWPRVQHLPMLVAKDLLGVAVWGYGLINNRVNWRGTMYRMQLGTRLIRIDTAPATLQPTLPMQPATAERAEKTRAPATNDPGRRVA